MREIFFILFTILFFSSCSKEEDETKLSTVYMPSKIIMYDNSVNPPKVKNITTFFYSGKKIVKTENESLEYGFKNRRIFTYEGDKIISDISSNLENGVWIENNYRYYDYYNDGRIKSLSESRPGILTTKFELSYESSNVVKCFETDINSDGQVFPHAWSNLIYNKKGVIETKTFLYNRDTNSYNTIPAVIKELEWDNFNKVTKNILGINTIFYHTLFRSSFNNLVKEKVTNNLENSVTIYNRELQYNKDGYPIKINYLHNSTFEIYEYIRL